MKKNITYKIEKELAVLSKKESGYTKEVNVVSWNNGKAKIDIRDWAPEKEGCGKGVTLTDDESYALMNVLKQYFDEE